MKNIKKKSAHNIYFGVDMKTGEMRHISEVQSGARCGCICATCSNPLEARKGEIRCHHFAHAFNNDCVYANEIAVYKEVERIIDSKRKLVLPCISLQFPTWSEKETLKQTQTCLLQQEAAYICDVQQYPPVLKISVDGHQLRLLIGFGDYYTEEDLDAIAAEARQENYSVLLFQFPDIRDTRNAVFFTSENLTDCVACGNPPAIWVRSELEDKWRKKYLDQAHTPKRNPVGYDCPIHIARYDGVFAARNTDCARCRFNLAEPPRCLCMGAAGIQSAKDFALPIEDRQAWVEAMRAANEKKVEDAEQQRAQSAKQRAMGQNKCGSSFQASLDAEYERIASNFDPESAEQTRDRFGRRWILCKVCGEIKLVQDMAMYGGKNPNRGICRVCARKL